MKNASPFSLTVLLVLGSLALGIIAYSYIPADMRALLFGHSVEHALSAD